MRRSKEITRIFALTAIIAASLWGLRLFFPAGSSTQRSPAASQAQH